MWKASNITASRRSVCHKLKMSGKAPRKAASKDKKGDKNKGNTLLHVVIHNQTSATLRLKDKLEHTKYIQKPSNQVNSQSSSALIVHSKFKPEGKINLRWSEEGGGVDLNVRIVHAASADKCSVWHRIQDGGDGEKEAASNEPICTASGRYCVDVVQNWEDVPANVEYTLKETPRGLFFDLVGFLCCFCDFLFIISSFKDIFLLWRVLNKS